MDHRIRLSDIIEFEVASFRTTMIFGVVATCPTPKTLGGAKCYATDVAPTVLTEVGNVQNAVRRFLPSVGVHLLQVYLAVARNRAIPHLLLLGNLLQGTIDLRRLWLGEHLAG